MGILGLGQQQDPVCLTASGVSSPSWISRQAEICIRSLPARPHSTRTCMPTRPKVASAETLLIVSEKSFEMPFGILLTQGRFSFPWTHPVTCSSTVRTLQTSSYSLFSCLNSLQHKSTCVPPRCSTHRLCVHREKVLPLAPLSKLSQKAEKEKQTRLLRISIRSIGPAG